MASEAQRSPCANSEFVNELNEHYDVIIVGAGAGGGTLAHTLAPSGKRFQPQVHYFGGGATKLYGAALYRLRPEDFGEIGLSEHHVLDNQYVVDTSFFPSIGAVNPAFTVMANAIRVGEYLLDRMA
jgi:ribulose 1,5-bisphosphate synthetase/thiazole synthase